MKKLTSVNHVNAASWFATRVNFSVGLKAKSWSNIVGNFFLFAWLIADQDTSK